MKMKSLDARRRYQPGLLVMCTGLLVLSAGALLTLCWGVAGQISLREGESCDQLLVTSRSVLTATNLADRHRLSTDFTFAPGPSSWPEGKQLDFGQEGGLGLKVLKYYRHAGERVEWVADAREFEGPALELKLCGPGGGLVDENWLAASLFGGEAVIGPTLYQLWPLPVATMLQDFLDPPGGPPEISAPTLGTLSIHHGGRMDRVAVDGNVGRRVPVGETGIEVELVACYLDARPNLEGGFLSRSDQPRNPLLELKIYFPGQAEAVRQIAFAKSPLVNLDGVRGTICPVRFWYHHPQLKRTPGAVFAQTPAGKLWCRPVVEGRYGKAEPVETGSQMPLGGQFSIHVVNHLAKARRHVSFTAIEPTTKDGASAESAALVEVTLGKTRREIWLQREDVQNGAQTIPTEFGPLRLSFGYQRLPLGFQLQLDDFVHQSDPGQGGDGDFASRVRLRDPGSDCEQPCEISTNRPLRHGRFTLHQTGVEQLAHGVETSTLKVVSDPGLGLKYAGCLLMCVGIAMLVLRRAFAARTACDILPRPAAIPGVRRAKRL